MSPEELKALEEQVFERLHELEPEVRINYLKRWLMDLGVIKSEEA